ncbi:aromatic ring-hydroxylating dioxygenase subunit alpha [Noviherbaspirillum sp.]|uniref:aromatic ring-hydroxylating oxygenase subunit alpha n=1 Tax=Noviherbaspirillum sp. TaxID=1926288 RepID=UPI002B45DC4F|nr:aromatic ring-hydroxylating dioxygenase subunit alpha [Noviherbaspirillum sp.]HJV79998.1 aromatic ring-hydroxylating dioxygenase subunit alpha [Noviherbaspirillum sp.]
MNHTEEMKSLVRRALVHLKNKTTDQADGTMVLPVDAYLDPVRYRKEVDYIFKRLPQALALSIELPQPKNYRTMTVMGVPVLMIRGEDNKVRAFINACRHRGSPVCEKKSGTAQRLVCPYHAWQYDIQGKLIGLYGEATFGPVSPETHSLTPLHCEERQGLIWVALTPGVAFDIDEWLGDFAGQLATLRLDNWYLYEQREIEGPGWKAAWDGYLEAYHHNSLHANTVGKYTIGNLLVHDTYGPHQRLTFARRSLGELEGKPEEEWDLDSHIRLIHSAFPNLTISGVMGDHCVMSQVYPGPTPDRTITRQTVLAAREPVTPEQKEATELFSQMVLQAVRDEDYRIGLQIQDGLAAGGNTAFTLGRNEPGLQHYHSWVAKFAAQA